MKIFFAGGASYVMENRYVKSGISKRLYSFHYFATCLMILNLIKHENISSNLDSGRKSGDNVDKAK